MAEAAPPRAPVVDSRPGWRSDDRSVRDHRCCEAEGLALSGVVGAYVGEVEESEAGPPGERAPIRLPRIDAYVGAQKVVESDGSVTAELSFTEGRFRLAGALSHYYESQGADRDSLTLTLPSLLVGARLGEGTATRVILEAGATFAVTRHDPMADTSLSGLVGGVQIEQQLTRRVAIVGAAHAMGYEAGVRARQLRVGVRAGMLQASVRYFDMSVGPALYGPEVGLTF
jgi:hypothetical protein